MANSKQIGDESAGMVIAALLQRKEIVLVPFGDNQRYDVVVDRNGAFVRIQIKTGRLERGAIEFDTCSSYAHRGRGHRDYRGDADLFGVYCPDTKKAYLVPVDEVGTRSGSLRVAPPRNGQNKKIRLALDYEL